MVGVWTVRRSTHGPIALFLKQANKHGRAAVVVFEPQDMFHRLNHCRCSSTAIQAGVRVTSF